MTATAPDDLTPDCYFFDCDHSIPAAQHELSRNCPICLHAEIGELRAALSWAMRSHVPDLAMIPPEYAATINAALAAERKDTP